MTCRALVGLAGILSLIVTVASGCGRGSKTPVEPPPRPPTDGVTASDRLGWDQDLLDGTDISAYAFVVYIDGSRRLLAGVQCDAQGRTTGIPCTALFPAGSAGPHTLELASVFNGEESPRSPPLVVTYATAFASVTEAPGPRAAPTEIVAAGLVSPTDLALAADGRLIVTERAGRVHILDGRPAREPALTLDDVDTRDGFGLFAVALHPHFERNGYLYLVYTERLRTGDAAYRVVRASQVGDTVGQVTTILSGVPASSPGWASLRFGPDEKLYVAFADIPGSDDRAEFYYNGAILRLNDDGSTPADSPASSPVYAHGEGIPYGLGWDSDGTLWVVEARDGAARLRKVGRGTYALAQGTMPAGMAIHAAGDGARAAHDLLLARLDGQGISRYRLRHGSDELDPLEPLVDSSFGPVRCLLPAARAIYFCTDSGESGGAGGRIVRLDMP